MDYRLTKQDVLNTLRNWNSFLRKSVHLIASGGTALTLLDIKPSTKDIDFIIPVESEYNYLTKILKDLGYVQIAGSKWKRRGEYYEYDFFKGKFIHTTELLESPLKKEQHIMLLELSRLYIGILNYYDLITSKLIRGSGVDVEDCIDLVRHKKEEIDIKLLKERFAETVKYDVSEDKANRNFGAFLKLLKKEKIYGQG